MKKVRSKIIAVLIVVFALIPLSVIYFPLSEAVPNLPVINMPNWLIPLGFISIVCIIILAFLLAYMQRD